MDMIRSLLARLIVPLFREDRGSVATEYGLTLLFVSLAIILEASRCGITVSCMFDPAMVFPSPLALGPTSPTSGPISFRSTASRRILERHS
jgi:Flp pilus assembly pilin Flp